jgi:hypothetical protein
MGPTYQSSPTSSPLPPPVPPRGDSAAAGRAPTPCIGDARRTCGWPRHPYLHPQRCFAGSGSLPMPCTSTTLIPYKLANGLTTTHLRPPDAVPPAAGRHQCHAHQRCWRCIFRRSISQQGGSTRWRESAHRRLGAGSGHIIIGFRRMRRCGWATPPTGTQVGARKGVVGGHR